ncbi:unnamed protein product [Didymodactylos carnosus]|uniref:Uncharacterized protein n=1 Tax=Didymodactylos carnosus TaxID=1234261 RepID=A0A8S2P7Y3_9BILA|nr:unnamed protein product [Didymodactylos carnosus]CAF4038487.1 unnamed protein product [Didymodactylos carnosus]
MVDYLRFHYFGITTPKEIPWTLSQSDATLEPGKLKSSLNSHFEEDTLDYLSWKTPIDSDATSMSISHLPITIGYISISGTMMLIGFVSNIFSLAALCQSTIRRTTIV